MIAFLYKEDSLIIICFYIACELQPNGQVTHGPLVNQTEESSSDDLSKHVKTYSSYKTSTKGVNAPDPYLNNTASTSSL